MIVKILFALLLGFIIGIEREYNDKPAGIRTLILVTLGSTIFTCINLIALNYNFVNSLIRYDFSRILAYLIVSVGFLSSGVIIVNKKSIEGITTASVLWCAVAVGILIGLERYFYALIISLIVFLVLQSKYIYSLLRKK